MNFSIKYDCRNREWAHSFMVRLETHFPFMEFCLLCRRSAICVSHSGHQSILENSRIVLTSDDMVCTFYPS